VSVADRLRVRRQPRRGQYSRRAVVAVLDATPLCHVAFVDRGQPYCIPFLHARVGELLYLHGAKSSRAIRLLATGVPACLTATILDGLVLARSVFEHSANYRCAIVLGTFRPVAEDGQMRALEAFTNALVPGRWDEVRAPSANELAATTVLSISLDQASVKMRSGPPNDGDSADAEPGCWAGVIPLTSTYGVPCAAPEVSGVTPLPASVRSLTKAARA
jgi:uncharacterized protein